MKPQTSPPLTYLPAYLGLFASLSLASACNSFLDIQYGTFGVEVICWVLVFGLSLGLAWRQQGEVSAAGRLGQKTAFWLGLLLLIFVSIPIWGVPRAVLHLLAILQVAQCCVTVTRRQLHLGLLVSLMMVVFASTHFRADWTMLFYLIPYVVAVVFTLVAEQISRRADDVRRVSLGTGFPTGQGVAILAATTAILLGGAVLYAITPQLTWPALFSSFGQPGRYGKLDAPPGATQGKGANGASVASGEQAADTGGTGSSGQPHAVAGANAGMEGAEVPSHGGWPTVKQMREAAGRSGMPTWQSASINGMADVAEGADQLLQPIRVALDDWWKRLAAWFDEHRQELQKTLLVVILLALMVAAWLLLKETRPVAWLRVRLDYLRLVMLERHEAGRQDALEYYAALQRLLDLEGLPRPPQANSREYLAQICRRYEHLRREAVELTLQFEKARYGDGAISSVDVARMRNLYRQMFHGVDLAGSLRRT